MNEKTPVRPPLYFWAVAILLLLWGIGGASIYVSLLFETPQEFARGAETAANEAAYAEYVSNIPWWALGAGILAAASRLLGAIGLLLRRAWAQPCYVVATAFFLVALFRAFLLANVASVMSPQHIATEGLFLALSLFGIWFARMGAAKGMLR